MKTLDQGYLTVEQEFDLSFFLLLFLKNNNLIHSCLDAMLFCFFMFFLIDNVKFVRCTIHPYVASGYTLNSISFWFLSVPKRPVLVRKYNNCIM